jgi:hypothetical protein
VCNTDARLIEWLHKVVGKGSVARERPRPNRRTQYTWIISSKEAEDFLREIYPYLVIKKEQADVVFKFRETFGKGQRIAMSPETLRQRQAHQDELQRLHGVGWNWLQERGARHAV